MSCLKHTKSLLQLWLVLATVAGLTAAGSAQTQNYPVYQGSNAHVGHNPTPATDNPLKSFLNWYYPQVGGVYAETQLSVLASQSPAASWTGATLAGAAAGYFIAPATLNPTVDSVTGVGSNPPYVFTGCVPSATNNVLAAASGQLQTFSWTFRSGANNQLPSGTAGDYALSVWTPVGPTVDTLGNYHYPERYFVYQVQYGTNQSAVYIVDQQATRGGWNRLGGSSTLFHYDGVNPITVTLYNTVPRDSNGNLIGVSANGNTLLNNPIVYANAVQISPNLGTFNASPVLGTNPDGTDPFPTRVLAAYNLPSNGNVANQDGTQNQGVLASIPFNGNSVNGLGQAYWTFSPALANNTGYTYTFPSPAVTPSSGWNQNTSPTPFYVGANYFSTPVTSTVATTQVVNYAPNLPVGTYAVYMWSPGSGQAGLNFGVVQVSVTENGVTNYYTVDLSQTNGYVQVGGRRFQNSTAFPLTVQISNYDTILTDAGKLGFANAVQFVGNTGLSINSTPVYANVNINTPSGKVMKAVNIVASEDGHIYCLDAKGRGDGTTDIYWAYPSLPNSAVANYVDPNITEGIDGTVQNGQAVTIAEMPTGFNTSSAIVQEVPVGSGNYYLYIGSTNGRVYCIDMSGRGDYTTGTRTAGTTRRLWSYPDDFPSNPKPSLLGSINNSVAFYANGSSIMVPTPQGRLYSLDAVGNQTARTTKVNWTYPQLNQPTLGAITTPALDGVTGGATSVYFGTSRAGNVGAGLLVSLNADTGSVNWTRNGTNLGGNATVFDDFLAAPTTAFNNLLGDGKNYIFIGNQNRYVYAFDDAGNAIWQTDELNATVSQPILFTYQSVLGNNQSGNTLSYTQYPSVVVPTDDGNFYGLFAGASQTNIVGTKLDWGYTADGDQILTGLAAGHQYMYGTDNHGYLYAFSNTSLSGGGGPGGGGPGSPVIPPNDPAAQSFANARIAFLTQAQYQALMKAIQAGTVDYTTFTNPTGFLKQTAFDFGETLYLFVYNFPYNGKSTGGTGTTPNMVNFTFSVEGNAQRSVPSESFQFTKNAPSGGPNGPVDDGFAVVPYALQPLGGVSLAPGSGRVSFTFSQISATSGRLSTVVANPLTQRINFTLANPLGIALQQTGQYGMLSDSLGADVFAFSNPGSDQNAFNGALTTPLASNGIIPANLILSAGQIAHGTQGSMSYWVYDRSLMALINGPDNGGLSGVRVERDNMAWNGGYGAVINPLSGSNSLYPALTVLNSVEDYPTNYPNDSLDYSDIHQENISVTKEPQGKTENPLFNSVSLEMPGNLFVEQGGVLTTKPVGNNAARTPTATPFETDVNVPMFQAANNATATDTLGKTVNSGYSGQFRVFVDANNNGKLDLGPGRRESFRLFTSASGVPVDQRLDVITPNVDLGSLSSGTGLLPSSSINVSTVFSPWYIGDLTGTTTQSALYQPFRVLNIGNVNEPNVRLAKAYKGLPWQLYDTANDSLAGLDGSNYMFSDLDPAFSLTGRNFANLLPGGETYVQKSRITERSGTELLTNPRYKTNANTGHSGSQTDTLIAPSQLPDPLLATPASPRVGITPPIGFPVGSYAAILRVINDNNSNLSLDANEPYSDPTFTLSFNVTESALTNLSSRNKVSNTGVQQHFLTGATSFYTSTTPMADNFSDLSYGGPLPNFLNANVQPAAMRDLYGNLVALWSSNRMGTATQGQLPAATGAAFRIFIGGLVGTAPNQAGGNTPLSDLGAFKAASNSQWFSVTTPYPGGSTLTSSGTFNSLFGVNANEHLLGSLANEADTVRFGNPALPLLGQVSPFDETQSFGQVFMAFSGTAQKQTPTGRSNIERLFLATVTPNNGGAPTIAAPIAIVDEPGVSAGRLSVLQSSKTSASVFYTSGGATQRHISVSTYANGAVTPSLSVPLGTGFQSASDPSASYRLVDASGANPLPSIELAFSGKLRGRANSEIFLARIAAPNGIPTANGNNVALNYFGTRTGEVLQSTGNKGEYRTLGVDWNPAVPFDIQVAQGTGLPSTILSVTTPPIQDPQTGIYRVSTTLGTAVVDPTVGTVRFANTVPGNNVRIYVTYQPLVLRVSAGRNAGFSDPSLVFENHLVGSSNYDAQFVMYDRYWYQNAAHVQLTNQAVRDARFLVSYNGNAIDSNNAGRPYYQTLRFGIQLPGPIPTLANGDVDFGQFNVTSNGPIQVDPSNGRVYFTTLDEDNLVTVKYNGVQAQYQVSYVTERPEAMVPMDQPLAESGLTTFVDPFDPVNVGNRRPPVFWMFWSSNRAGSSDIFFQTIAPLLYPISTSH